MAVYDTLPFLFGQADASSQSGFVDVLIGIAVFFAVTILPFFIGKFVAQSIRMPDYWWKIGLLLCSVTTAGYVTWSGWPPNLGVDLKGGVILIYEIEEELSDTGDNAANGMQDRDAPTMGDLVQALNRRINPSGTKEIVVRRYGDKQVEIIIPEADPIEIEWVKKKISTAGALQFRIVANRQDNQYHILQAENMADDPVNKRSRVVEDDDGEQIAYWTLVGREEQEGRDGIRPLKVSVLGDIIRVAKVDPQADPAGQMRRWDIGDIITLPPNTQFDEENNRFEDWLARQGILDIEILMATDDKFDVKGDHLGAVSAGFDETMRPSVNFRMSGAGVPLFRALTSSNLPDKQTGFPSTGNRAGRSTPIGAADSYYDQRSRSYYRPVSAGGSRFPRGDPSRWPAPDHPAEGSHQ